MQCLFYTEQMSTKTILKAIQAIQAARAYITWEVGHTKHPKYTIEGFLNLLKLPGPERDQTNPRQVATLLYSFDNLPRPDPAIKPDLHDISVVLKGYNKAGADGRTVKAVKAKIANQKEVVELLKDDDGNKVLTGSKMDVVELLKGDDGDGNGVFTVPKKDLPKFKCTSDTSLGISVELETSSCSNSFACQAVEIHWEWVITAKGMLTHHTDDSA